MGNGMAAMLAFFNQTPEKKHRVGKGCTNLQLICDAPRTHPGLRYTAHTRTSLSCFDAAAKLCIFQLSKARGPGGTAATAPLLSLSRTARGEGTTSQCH